MENIIKDNIPSEINNAEDKNFFEKVLDLALKIGVGILSSGGSVSRVETAVDKICTAYGAEEVSVAAFHTMVIASVKIADGREYTLLKRVYSSSNNLSLLEKFNQLSRDVCREKYPPDEALRKFFELTRAKPRNKLLTVFGAAGVAATYAVFFGGTVEDCLPAFIVAFVMAGVNELLSTRSLNAYATTFLLSVLGGLLSISLCKLCVLCGLQCHGALVMIGTIMILIPGLMLTNAVRDLFTGDLMTGTMQITNALLLTVVIASGYAVSMLILGSIADFIPAPDRSGWEYFIYFMVSGILGTVAICLFFNLNPRRLGWAIGATALTLGVYLAFAQLTESGTFVPVFAAALFAAILSEILARIIKSPATVFLIPAIIALVPGSSLYYTMEAIVGGDLALAGQRGTGCVLIILGLAVGICVAAVLFRVLCPVKLKFYKKNKLAYLRQAEKYVGEDEDDKKEN